MWDVVEAVLSLPPITLALAAVAVAGLAVAYQRYQRCPHCGRLVRRVVKGWRRCGGCGRQYRRGLKLR